MQNPLDQPDLSVDLNGGVVPISRAASSLAALLRRCRERRRPIVVTQKGYPSGVILSIDVYNQLCAQARLAPRAGEPTADHEPASDRP